jgi:predicted esterase
MPSDHLPTVRTLFGKGWGKGPSADRSLLDLLAQDFASWLPLRSRQLTAQDGATRLCFARTERDLYTMIAFLLIAAWAFGQSQPTELRYKLIPGDRLTYSETFDRRGKSPDQNFHTHAVFINQLVVIDSSGGRSLVGVQRNRQSAEMLEYHEHGKDTLVEQRAIYDKAVAQRPKHFSDTNLYSATGQAELPLQAVRELTSKRLYELGEIMTVPAQAVQIGSEWDVGVSGLRMKLENFESVGGESCAILADTGSRKDTHLRFTFCPESGHLAKLDFEGEYRQYDGTIHEHLTLELIDSHRQENVNQWAADPLAQLAAFKALMVGNAPLPDASVMNKVLTLGPPDAQALALATYLQHGATPAKETLQALRQSQDAEIRRIAERFDSPAAKPASQPCELPVAHYSRQKPGTTLHFMSTSGFTDTPYMIHVPPDYRGDQPFPLIVVLSGGAGLAFDAALSSQDAVRHAEYLVVYPNAGGRMWWDASAVATVQALLLEVQRAYNVETNRVYLTGFSNGGTGTIELGVRWPDRFAAIASLMGAGLDTPSLTKLPLQNLYDLPVLFVHGDKDPRIPASSTQRTYEELRELKPVTAPELHILKGRAHDVSLSADDGLTLPFFARFTRDPFPHTVKTVVFDPRFSRQYWLEVVEPGKDPPEVDARILPENTIDIKARNVKKLRLLLRPELFSTPGPVRIRINGKEQAPVELKRDCQLFTRSAESNADPFLAYTDEVVIDVP